MDSQTNGSNISHPGNQNINIRDLINILKRHYLIVLIVTLLSLIITGIVSFFVITPMYEAKTMLMVNQVSNSAEMQQNNMNTYVGQVKSVALMQRVINKLDLDNPTSVNPTITPRTLSNQVKVTSVKNSNLMEISVVDANPHLATKIANTLSEEYMVFLAEKNQEIINQSVKLLENQIKTLEQQLINASEESERLLLQDTINLLRNNTRLSDSNDRNIIVMTVISPAIEPVSPVTPNIVQNMFIAFLLGLMISIALVFVKEVLDNTIKSPQDVQEQLGLPVLGCIVYADRHTL